MAQRGSGTIRLWCISSASLDNVLDRVNSTFRWSRLTPIPDSEQAEWSRDFGPYCYIIGETQGEYNGCLGHPQHSLATDLQSTIQSIESKHPSWSKSKIDRAARAKCESTHDPYPNGFPCCGDIISRQEACKFLEFLYNNNTITLVLDNSYGTMDRIPIQRDRHKFVTKIDSSNVDSILPLNYMDPVTITDRH